MERILKIGTRGSELALRQTEQVLQSLRTQIPGLQAEIATIRTDGDERTDLPLHEVNQAMGTQDKGVFVAALENALAAGEIDCAVHSLKDMPGKQDERFELAAVLPREDIWDVLILKAGADRQRLTIGTSSVRRAHLVRTYWSGTATTVSIRGNVTTRLRKLIQTPELDGIVLARAGLNRLGYTGDSLEWEGTRLCIVDMSKDSFMPALGQGALAVEIRKGDEEMKTLLSCINHRESELCARAERAFLAALGADCSTPVAGYATCNKDFMMFRALYFTPNGTPLRVTHRGSAAHPEQVGLDAYEKLKYHFS